MVQLYPAAVPICLGWKPVRDPNCVTALRPPLGVCVKGCA